MSYYTNFKDKIKNSSVYLLLLIASLLITTIMSPVNATTCDDYFILNLYEDDTDSIYQIHKFNDQNNVLNFTPINTNLETTGISGINAHWFNTLSYNPVDSRLYGIVYDTNDPLYPMYLYSMMVTGSNITNHGVIHSDGIQNLTRDFGSYPAIAFTDGQSFTQQVTNYTPGDEDDEGYTAAYFSGAINPAGTHLYLFHFDDYHILKVDLATQKFTVLQQDTLISSIASGDFSFDSAGFLYAIKQDSSELVKLNPEAGTASSIALIWQGLAPINITYPAHLLLRDDNTAQFIHRYGTHDLDNDGVTREYTGPALYEVTISTGIVSAVKAVDSQYNDWTFDDVAGCATALSITEDYGDAPQGLDLLNGYDTATYPVTTANDGARHTVIAGVCLGTEVPANCSSYIDTEVAPAPHINATTDGLDDGVQINPNDSVIGVSNQAIIQTNRFINGTDVNVNNELVITASAVGFINIWLDINQDGDWNDTVNGQSELVATSAVIQGENSITFTIPSSSVHGPSYLRVRYASNAADIATVTGLATDGEVEDYLVNIAAPSLAITGCNVGVIQNGGFDIPAGTPSQGLTDEYFREENVPGWSIGPHSVGSFITYDWDSSGNLVQSRERYGPGNATTPTGGNIAELNTFIPQMYYQDIVTDPGQTLAWDFYWSPRRKTSGGDQQAEMRMGTPDNLQQVQLTEQKSSTDVGFIQYTGIYTVPANQYITRVAWLPVQWVSDGEGNLIDGINVGCVPSYDYGDAPDTSSGDYNTLLSNNGPRHQLLASLYLGENAPDDDDGLLQDATATADDQTNNNDEDNLANLGLYDTSTSLSFSQLVTNSTLNDAYFYAWVDWNNNGTFERNEFVEGGGAIGNAIVVSAGDTTVDSLWSTLPSLSAGDSVFMRLRLSDQLLADTAATTTAEDPRSLGSAGFGEVEDHKIHITPDFTQSNTLTCSSSSQALTGADITTLLNYTNLGGVSIVGEELHSTPVSGNHPAKRFELEVLAPGKKFTYPIGIEAEFRLKNFNSGDGDFLFWLTDHVNMNGVLIADIANNFTAWVGKDAGWNGTNSQISGFTNGAVNQFGNATGSLSSTVFKRYRLSMYVQSDQSTTLQLTVMNDDGSLINQSPIHFGVRSLDPSQGIWLTHTSHNNDPSSQRYIFGGMSMVISDASGCDYGDAPDIVTGTAQGDYETLSINGGPSHIIDSNIFLGNAVPDSDSDGFGDGTDSQRNGSDDDIKGTTPDDEDAIAAAVIVDSPSTSINVMCNDFSAGSGDLGATVHGWLDANRNGEFEEHEYTSQSCSDSSSVQTGSAILAWTGLSLIDGESYLRLRITDDNLVDTVIGDSLDERAYGAAISGEVEDHNITIVVNNDYGDAPDNGDASDNAMDDYTTLLATNGPYHQIPLTGSVAYLGSNAPDRDDGTLANTQADNDDTTEMSVGIDDEDAISTLLSISDQATAYALTISCHGHNSPVFGWIDINQNGIFEASLNEQASANCFDVTPNVDGSVTLNWNGWNSTDVVIGETILRLRIVPDSQFSGQDSSVTPEDERSIITAVGGEIEDHRIKITRTGDYGDAPVSYEQGAPEAAVHTAGIYYLGSSIDEETGRWLTSDGDDKTVDNDGNGDDEEGVSFALYKGIDGNSNILWNSSSISVEASEAGFISIWIDWLRDGNFTQTDDTVILDLPVTQGDNLHRFMMPSSVTEGTVWARIRFCKDSGECNTVSGHAPTGEVEDHQVSIGPVICLSLGDQFRMPASSNSFIESSTNEIGITRDQGNQRGAFWTKSRFDMSAEFRLRFGIYLGNHDGADGVAFIMHNDPNGTEAIGDLGGYLGARGIQNSIGVEFDTYENGSGINDLGNNQDHTAIMVPSSSNLASVAGTVVHGLPEIENDRYYEVIFDWDPNQQQFKYYFDGTLFDTLTEDLITNYFGGSSLIYYGMTGSTGGATNLQKICIIEQDITFFANDLGDAPDDGTNATFHTLLDSNGPVHEIGAIAGIYLGDIEPDLDPGTYQDIDANQDDTNDNSALRSLSDEDAVNNVILDSSKSTFTLNVPCNDFVAGGDLEAIVHGWIDFNGNQQFERSEYAYRECIDVDEVSTGTVILRWIDITQVQEGTSYLRLRITNQSLPQDLGTTAWDEASTGGVVGGEVEDHKITFSQASDFGDAPDTYKTLSSNNGAEHGLGSYRYSLYLGSIAADADSNGFSNGTENNPNTATDDNNTDTSGISAGNDEDAVTGMPGFFINSTDYQIDVVCNDHDGNADLGANVYGWVDFDNNGSFDVSNNEFSQATCDDTDATSDGSATLSFTGFTAATVPATTFSRLRITTQALGSNDSAGFAIDGEVEDYAVIVGFKVSGKVFTDSNSAVTDGMNYYNGNLDAGELGIGNVVVTLYDVTTNTCQSTTTDTNGDYALAALTNHQYKLYETANETTPAPLVCPPEVGAVNSDGLLVHNTITDPTDYTSSSSNIIDLGTITSDDSGNNFADISAPGFASCDADGYLSLRTPADLFAVDLFTGDTEELAADITSIYKNGSLQVGYMMQYNHIIGDITQTNAKLIGLIDGNYNVHLLPIILTGSNINIAFNNATISDDGILYMAGGNTGYILKVDVNPASETYLQEVGRPSISSFGTADFAINPLDGKLYGLRSNGTIAIFDPATNTRNNSKNVNKVISAGVTRNYNSNHFTSGYGAIYFDQAGNMYAVNNGKYTQGDISAPVLQIPIGNEAAANYTATIVSNLGFTMSSNDGARCRYAPLGLDFGDAPDTYQTLNSSSGPYHVTRNNSLWIGDNKPDNDVNGTPQIDAFGDDRSGTTPDDEDGFDNQVRVFVNNGSGSLTVPITNNSGKTATLYAWVDFNQLNGFELSERASIAVSAATTQADVTVNWNGLAGVVTGDTYLRLRLCTDDATAQCSIISGPASNGEVEDHLAKVIEGVFPDTTCDGIYQSNGNSATSFDFGALTTTLPPYNVSSIISHQTGFDNLNAIAFDRIGGVFYGSFVDSGNNLHIAMFDKLGNMVDVGMPTASTDFDIVNVTTGVITSITSGNPIIAPTTLVGQLGTIDNNGEYLYLGHINSAQILRVNLNSFTVDTVNLLLPDIGLSSGNGLSLLFDSDWVFNAESGLIYTTELETRTLYIINPISGAISATAIDFGTTIPNASSYGIVMGRNNFAYIMTNGDYDSDLNGSLESTGTALYQLNILSKKALYLGSVPNAVATYSDAAGCIGSAKDFGDASSNYGSVSHQFSDNNSNGVNDYSLGMQWDSEFNAYTSTNARDDNLYTLADEDGVIIPPQLQAGVNTLSLVASEAGVVNIWLDYQRGGNFDSSEQLLTNYAVIAGNNAISLTLDSVAMGTYNGATVMRVRYCAATGQCDEFNDIEQGISAVNGEVEDYQVWTSAVLLVTNSCDNLTLSHGTSGSFSLEILQPQATPFTTTKLQQPVVIAGLSNFDRLNALGIHPESYLIYGIATDTNTANDDVHLVVTDQSGVEVIDLGGVVSSVNQTLELISSTSIVFNKNQPLANSVNGIIMHTATRGAIDPAGEYLYLHHKQWQSLIKVDIQDQTFTVVSLQNTLTPMGGDMAFSHNGYLYNADILNGLLYRLDPIGGTADTLALNWLGASMPSAGGAVGAAFMDSGIFLYVVTKNGTHDIDHDGSLEHSGSAMYRINTLTGDIVAIAAMGETYTDNLDGAGCFVSADYGDSAAINDGNVSHQFYDSDADGVVDYGLGTLFDPELTQFNSSDGLGDDNHDIDDEDGINMPTSIVVNSIVNVDVTVTNQNIGTLKLNVWADMNGNGSYRDSGEQIVNELDVTDGINTVQLLLPAAYTQGYNGNSTVRFRLCAQANQCNAPDDNQLGMVAPNGEVEDYPFELINQIIIKGFVFEDNAVGGATAHDGIMSHSEVGLGRFTVQAIYQGSSIAGYSAGDILATVRTRGNGSYELLLPVEVATQTVVIDVIKQSAWIDISESDLQSITQATSTSVTDSQITVVANAGDNVEYLNFGKVKSLRLEADNFTHVEPGKFVYLPHRLETYTAGSVSFAITNAVITPVNSSWSMALYRDHNCNRQLDNVDNSLLVPISVTGYDTVCLLSKVFVPNNAVLNSQAHYAVNATMIFDDLLSLGHGITRVVTDLDTIRVTFAGAGELVLEKTVNNITQATGKLTQNIAKPNDILQYEIIFSNIGTGVITDVTIFDDTPAYTYLSQALDCNDFTYPTTLTCSVNADNGSNINGYEGLINVTFIGELQPTEKGVIYYQVHVK